MANKEIRTILAPLKNSYLLLPNSAVAEVLGFTQPQPFKKAPSWLLGELAWHGWQVPVINIEQLVYEEGKTIQSPKSKILVIKTLGESTQVNYIGVVIQGLPRLKKVTVANLIETQKDDMPKTLFSKVTVDDLEAVIPELGDLTYIVEQAAYGN